jgi:2-hydroxycyclohexanecarboxyl-CoA dehydrogenase
MSKVRRALVTGGGQGIGAAIARRLSVDGFKVVIADLDGGAAASVANEIGGIGRLMDASDPDGATEFVLTEGPFEVLVNNAGRDQHAFFTTTNIEDWQQLIAANLISVLACTHAVLPAMQTAGYGRIINIGSEAGRLGSRGGSVYAASKGGVTAFTKSIARENARFAITANVVAPGPVDTPMLRAAISQDSVPDGDRLLKAMENSTLLHRLGTPDEVAATVAFLASEEAGFITGETIGVSGGMGLGMT